MKEFNIYSKIEILPFLDIESNIILEQYIYNSYYLHEHYECR